jgi:hypothetical protein
MVAELRLSPILLAKCRELELLKIVNFATFIYRTGVNLCNHLEQTKT